MSLKRNTNHLTKFTREAIEKIPISINYQATYAMIWHVDNLQY